LAVMVISFSWTLRAHNRAGFRGETHYALCPGINNISN
jgi:hypothetical protein